MQSNEVLVLIDLENISLKYAIEEIKNIKCEYKAYAFCDFTIHSKNVASNLFYEYNIKPIQVFHQKNKKNNADFVLLRYAYSHIFQNKNLKHIYLFSGDTDFIDLCYFIKEQSIKLTVLNLKSNIDDASKEINTQTTGSDDTSCSLLLTNAQKDDILKEEYRKVLELKIGKNKFIENIKIRIPNLHNQKLSQVLSFINNCNSFDDVIDYCKKDVIFEIYNTNKHLSKDKLWHKINQAFKCNVGQITISSLFPKQDLKTVKQLIEYILKEKSEE